ncbi:hypothetical protein J2P86_03405 [Staphylococcus sp. 30400_3112M30941]|nr:hypothetical protein [Staphylococcus sp. 30403_3112M30944]MBO0945621.1 hypothetical protein [Staphylococcus sp. 30402_3112M30943]MBO0963629.1 hypothetical protein [Staphylococcus sp. 30400_3112M30941]MBO0967682.1 hypothetical protein [Staphylococcus sp. 30401_3112M30942]
MKISKVISSLFLSTIVITSVPTVADSPQVKASEQNANLPHYVTIDGVKINRNPDLPQNPQAQERIGGSKVVKTAIKFIINHKSEAKEVIKKVGGKKAANIFDEAYSNIEKELNPILSWSEVPANAFGNAVKRGAINAGLSKGDAGIISTVAKEAISWLF